MKCSEIQDLLSAFYDGELSREVHDAVAGHIGKCGECAAELASFKQLSSIAAVLDAPETPTSDWSAVEQELDRATVERASSATTPSINRRKVLKYVAALAATLLIGFVGLELWTHSGHDHEEMVKAMEYVAANPDSEEITTHLLGIYDGREVSPQEALTQVGFRPVASSGLPAGYRVESIQVLDMPCCKCTQTSCLRPDNTRFFIFEHDNEDTGWFEHRTKRTCNCGGKDCEVVELDYRLAATYEDGNRHVTLLGVRDEEEIDLLVSQFEDKS